MSSEANGRIDPGHDRRNRLSRREAVLALGTVAACSWLYASSRAARAVGIATAAVDAAPPPTPTLTGPAELPPRTVGLRSLGGDFRYDPPGLLVARGESVTWLNMGDFHTVTAFHPAHAGLLPQPVPLRIPEGAEPFHSGMLGLDAGSDFEHVFEVEGVHDYFCQPHYSFGMVGRIVAGRARGGPPLRDDSELTRAARDELPPVETIVGPAGRAYEWASRINGVLLLRTRDSDAGVGAEAVLDSAGTDERLLGRLRSEGAEKEFFDRLGAFVDAVAGAAGYEILVERADAAKRSLVVLLPTNPP